MYYIVIVEDRHVESVEAYHSLDVAVDKFKELLDEQEDELELPKEEILDSLDLFIEGANNDVEIPYTTSYGNQGTIALTI